MTRHDGDIEMQVDIEPIGRRINVLSGMNLFEASREAGIELVSLCGGIGSCDSCRIQLISGKLTDPTIEEEAVFSSFDLEQGWRLACQSEPLENVKISIPPESLTTPQRLQLEGERADFTIDPPLQVIDLQIKPADIRDLRSDTSRVVDAIENMGLQAVRIEYPVLRELPLVLRKNDWAARVTVDSSGELIAVMPVSSRPIGLAVDIGTTSIASYLVDLQSGSILGKKGEMNPQIAYGEDVVSRIHFSNEHVGGRDRLQNLLVGVINRLATELCETAGYGTAQIVDMVAVGNTAMHHLFVGLPVRQLGESPYVPVTSDGLVVRAGELGVRIAVGAKIYLPPIIAGYVGADHTAMLLATGVWQADKTEIAIDIGTNTEVSLSHHGRVFCCSCASGPAFEGAHINAGMRAAPGAIERVQLYDGGLRIQTIGNVPAIGLCGSGIVDAIAVMAKSELINHKGAFERSHEFASVDADGRQQFVLVPGENSGNSRDIAVTRKDVAEVQLAKGAIRTGIEILLYEAGIQADEVEKFTIAGAFGSYINVASAMRLGLFPALPLSRFRQVGNAAGMGAYQLLVSNESREQVDQLARKLEYVELTTHPMFSSEFIRQMSF
ncbi:MAG: ASKHA domain-containing protein [Candidatus Promineifilaceae bacterium]